MTNLCSDTLPELHQTLHSILHEHGRSDKKLCLPAEREYDETRRTLPTLSAKQTSPRSGPLPHCGQLLQYSIDASRQMSPPHTFSPPPSPYPSVHPASPPFESPFLYSTSSPFTSSSTSVSPLSSSSSLTSISPLSSSVSPSTSQSSLGPSSSLPSSLFAISARRGESNIDSRTPRFSSFEQRHPPSRENPSPDTSLSPRENRFSPTASEEPVNPPTLAVYTIPHLQPTRSDSALVTSSPLGDTSSKKSNIRFFPYQREKETRKSLPNVTVFRPSELLHNYAKPTSPGSPPSPSSAPNSRPSSPPSTRSNAHGSSGPSHSLSGRNSPSSSGRLSFGRAVSPEEKYERQYQKHLLNIQSIYDSIPIIGEDKAFEELERERQRQRQRDYRKRLYDMKIRNQTPEEKAQELEKRWHTHYQM
eukprot:TRINITY_DN5172_c0_g1_i1.p1 TRINITY_DN5172_c0_g1~~TRINITY_DN5172_c0_g1_i1.p1  ORF type:complete len:418 (-),score=70.29 TRINITY_DN5172_c0_g1_i1:211-1464(-)